MIDDSDGIFFPARYHLGDGSVLLSYRLGHSALLRRGDRISTPSLPVLSRDGQQFRLVVRYEHLTIQQREDIRR